MSCSFVLWTSLLRTSELFEFIYGNFHVLWKSSKLQVEIVSNKIYPVRLQSQLTEKTFNKIVTRQDSKGYLAKASWFSHRRIKAKYDIVQLVTIRVPSSSARPVGTYISHPLPECWKFGRNTPWHEIVLVHTMKLHYTIQKHYTVYILISS